MTDEAFTVFAGLPMGVVSLAGLDESVRQVGETEARETWNGTTHVLRPSFKRKFEVTLTCSSDRAWIPDVDLMEPGARVVYHALTAWNVRLTPGDTHAVLLRDPVPGSVHVRDALEESVSVPHGLSQRTVSIMGRAGHARVWYRPILRCVVVSLEFGSSGRSRSWTLVLREETAP